MGAGLPQSAGVCLVCSGFVYVNHSTGWVGRLEGVYMYICGGTEGCVAQKKGCWGSEIDDALKSGTLSKKSHTAILERLSTH